MYVLRPGLPISMQKRTRLAGILGLLFTAALPHSTYSSHTAFGTWLPGLLPYALPQGIGKTTQSLSSARYTIEKS
eukprot:1009093-Pelagomonas_calceolata.AAC.4